MLPLRRALRTVQPIVMLAAIGMLVLVLARQWGALGSYQWRLSPGWLAASGSLLVMGWLVEIGLWRRLLGLLGAHLAGRDAARIWFASAIVRYVPGNVWQPLSFTVLGRERGIRTEVTLGSLSLFHMIHVLAVGPIAAIYLATSGRTSAFAREFGAFSPWWSVAVAVPVVVVIVRPGIMLATANAVLVRAGREPFPGHLSTRRLLGCLTTSLGAWALFAGAFTTLALGVIAPLGVGEMTQALPHLLVAYPVAYVVGFLSLLTPGGLLVREGMLFLLLEPIMGRGNAIIVALAMRVWEIALELAVAGAVLGAPLVRRRVNGT